jgi:hypothetical protein
MEFEPQDQKVVELLAKLKSVNEGYPSEMLAARRQTFLNNMAGVGLAVGTGTALKHTLKDGNGAAPVTVGTLLEVALVIAMVAEAGTLAYFNRDKIAEVFRSISTTPKVQEIASPPVITSPFPELEISEIPSSAMPTGTASEIATSTPVAGTTDDPTSNNNGAATLTDSTPDPSANNENNGTNGNNGNHYGQTPKPERTKDNQLPNDNPDSGNSDKPPKEEKDKNP